MSNVLNQSMNLFYTCCTGVVIKLFIDINYSCSTPTTKIMKSSMQHVRSHTRDNQLFILLIFFTFIFFVYLKKVYFSKNSFHPGVCTHKMLVLNCYKLTFDYPFTYLISFFIQIICLILFVY